MEAKATPHIHPTPGKLVEHEPSFSPLQLEMLHSMERRMKEERAVYRALA